MINFTDLKDKLAQFNNGLLTQVQIEKWIKENVKVKSYLSITEKYALSQFFSEHMSRELKSYSEQSDAQINFIYMMYDINLFFDVMFKYTEITPLYKHKTTENYDLLVKTGFYDYIMSICEKDYNKLVAICDRVTGIGNLVLTMQLQEIFGKDPKVEDFERIRDIINDELDPEKLKLILDIEKMNDPQMAKVVNGIRVDAIKEALTGGDKNANGNK